ncbi:hypothetical protein PHJA_001514500 [Phtheirospermum japonicum]|uniref:Uncharacterized protein n=1 Tax=Phtheirospermum japonicum TaxID=374723 RepID=A0A830CH79_9LAMI|nr:hypothetical protein PHJA_001514500 [Phtheirospermum japonicum]
MFCSVSTGKSGSSWLDRLRTSKGFDDDDGPTDLDKFLQNPNTPSPETADPKPKPDPIRDEDNQLFNIMSNVLNELFNFGDNPSNSTKFTKSARKQKNPRICAIPSNGGNATTLLRSCDEVRVKESDRCENEGRDVNLVGFSRTEVTVIDTSYESWKFEKFLYRKKNVWKVRDKKVKSESVGRKKKRKSSGSGEEEDGRKKSKVDKNGGIGGNCDLPLNEITMDFWETGYRLIKEDDMKSA